jgi:hypothetical protein
MRDSADGRTYPNRRSSSALRRVLVRISERPGTTQCADTGQCPASVGRLLGRGRQHFFNGMTLSCVC